MPRLFCQFSSFFERRILFPVLKHQLIETSAAPLSLYQ